MESYQVVVVHDHVMFRDALRLMLPPEEFTIVGEAGAAKEAVRLCQNCQCDLIVLKAGLPDAEPEALVRMLLSVQKGKAPILLLTIQEDPVFLARLLRAGVRGIVAKSEPFEVFVSAARTVAGGGEYLSPGSATRISFLRIPEDLRSCLSDRQREVSLMIARGLGNKEIAKALGVELNTVRTHRRLAMQRLNVSNAVDMARIVRRELLLEKE
jgi:DNA-binding NarL/FixJ family response regulator